KALADPHREVVVFQRRDLEAHRGVGTPGDSNRLSAHIHTDHDVAEAAEPRGDVSVATTEVDDTRAWRRQRTSDDALERGHEVLVRAERPRLHRFTAETWYPAVATPSSPSRSSTTPSSGKPTRRSGSVAIQSSATPS